MTDSRIDGFDYRRLPGADGITLNVATAGTGDPIVLLHGFPQTHLMWRHVARELAEQHTVIVPDLRGYGASDKPEETSPHTYSKRTMAHDIRTAASELGFDRFALIGHDRGALVGVRAGLDHPDTITHLGILDVLPTMDSWDVLHGAEAAVAWHLYLMAQPKGLPERMIEAVAADFFGSFLDAWDPSGATFAPPIRRHYIDSSTAAIPSIVADYRATAGIDLEMDRADREAGAQLAMPVAVLSQDWGAVLGFDAAALWRQWAPAATYQPITTGHFMAEEKPAAVTEFVRELLTR
ncbi:alpha/beta fold hydrolase [Nocardia macrotermitis]|uniref:Fluoroacetate dehalogenase n=1 Tax=Nocardia macrotermitis TaxID=2585198 RepID=A0A7K0D8W0_9NOCA|nr:alpha/beta hydrolase [Nocardia macrotermitis]MQY22148.1 Fluoroacetate dehalogenase [Nocardia macrotermitis]